MPAHPGIAHVQELEIWRDGVDLVELVYRLSQRWPKHETHGLVGQSRRAAVSFPSNIAEGLGRGGHREIARYTSIALGSLYELDTQIIIARRLSYSSETDCDDVRTAILSLVRRSMSFLKHHQRLADKRPV